MSLQDELREQLTATLLPCPFCGNKLSQQDPLDTIYPVGRNVDLWQVVCQANARGCDTSTLGCSPSHAAEKWNKRDTTQLSAAQAERDALRRDAEKWREFSAVSADFLHKHKNIRSHSLDEIREAGDKVDKLVAAAAIDDAATGSNHD